MGYREGNSYKITCYLTPEADIKLVKIGLEHDENLKIEHDAKNGVKVAKKQQEKLHFLVDVCDVPYHIPYLYIHYTYSSLYSASRTRTAKYARSCPADSTSSSRSTKRMRASSRACLRKIQPPFREESKSPTARGPLRILTISWTTCRTSPN